MMNICRMCRIVLSDIKQTVRLQCWGVKTTHCLCYFNTYIPRSNNHALAPCTCLAHAKKHKHTSTQACIQARTHTNTHTQARKLACTHTHTNTPHNHTHTQAHTHAHKHAVPHTWEAPLTGLSVLCNQAPKVISQTNANTHIQGARADMHRVNIDPSARPVTFRSLRTHTPLQHTHTHRMY